MIHKPNCLHLPPLHNMEGSTLSWEAVDGAQAYEIDAFYSAQSPFVFPDTPSESWRVQGESLAPPRETLSWKAVRKRAPAWSLLGTHEPSWRELHEKEAPEESWRMSESRQYSWRELREGGLDWADWLEPACTREHRSHTVRIPVQVQGAVFRIRACGDAGVSAYLVSAPAAVSIRYTHDDVQLLELAAGERVEIPLFARDILHFADIVIALEYDPAGLQLTDIFPQLTTAPDISAGPVVVSHDEGRLRFYCSRQIPEGRYWSGAVGTLEVAAAQDIRMNLTLS